MQPEEKPSLYDRLGGVYNIATVVDDLIDRVMAGPKTECQSSSGRSASSCATCGIQVFGDRDGLLGGGRSATIYGQVDVRLACAVEDYQQGVGCIRG
jgi:hypothetical protein